MPAQKMRRLDHLKLRAEQVVLCALERADNKAELDAIVQHFNAQIGAAWERVSSRVDGSATEVDISSSG